MKAKDLIECPSFWVGLFHYKFGIRLCAFGRNITEVMLNSPPGFTSGSTYLICAFAGNVTFDPLVKGIFTKSVPFRVPTLYVLMSNYFVSNARRLYKQSFSNFHLLPSMSINDTSLNQLL